jgi:hypothetical protein
MTAKRKLAKIFKLPETVDSIVDLHRQLMEIFLKNLPKRVTIQELVHRWGSNWKNIESDDFIYALDEITKQALNKIKNFDQLTSAWFSTLHPRLRWHLKNRILISLKIRQINLNPEQVFAILRLKKIKFNLKQMSDLIIIINYQNYPQK